MSLVRSDDLLKAALDYAYRGWRVVPLWGVRKDGTCECGNREEGHARSAGKHPRIKAWQNEATTDEEMILSWWSRWPNSNVGVHMGEASGLVDIECDSEEAEQELLRLYDGNIPIVPTFQSARGKHRLFRWRPGLPNPDKAGFKIGELEIQTGNDHGKQSVFPPSSRGEVQYKWLITPDECELGEISDELIIRMENLFGEAVPKATKPKSERMKLYEQDAVLETVDGRDNVIYKEACHLWRLYSTVRGPRAFHDADCQSKIYQQMWAWNSAKCRPPLSDDDVLKKVESARDFIARQVSYEKSQDGPALAMHGLEWRDGEWWPGNWEVTALLGDPPLYYLYVPAWTDLMGAEKQICLEYDVYRDAGAVAQAIFKATKTVIVDDRPGAWPAIWNGTKGSVKDKVPPTRGLKAKLIDKAKLEEVSADDKKQVLLAELLAEKLNTKIKEAEAPDTRGKPTRLPDGGIWVRWMKIWDEELMNRKVTTQELRMLSRAIGIGPKNSKIYPTSGSNRLRYVVLTPEHVAKINQLCELPEPAPPVTPPVTPPSAPVAARAG